jgi:nitrogen-specific signal transduction histidine kinase
VLESDLGALLLEFREIDQRIRMDREARMLESVKVNRELVRNLAHEIKNPLGGIRGAAQLLETEVSGSSLREYTQVIIKEADRLQTLVDRLLAPHRHPRLVGDVNIHEVLERVRSVVGAEYPQGLDIVRDYDASLPDFRGDKEQLIQAMLNLVRNAAQALRGQQASDCGSVTGESKVREGVALLNLRSWFVFPDTTKTPGSAAGGMGKSGPKNSDLPQKMLAHLGRFWLTSPWVILPHPANPLFHVLPHGPCRHSRNAPGNLPYHWQ